MSNQLTAPQPLAPALISAVELWADATTDTDTTRREDLKRDKALVLIGDGYRRRDGKLMLDKNGDPRRTPRGFFVFCSLPLELITPADVKDWQVYLESEGLGSAAIYSRVSRLSSFFDYLLDEPTLRGMLKGNPVILARPKAPKAYQSGSVKALTDDQARALLRLVKQDADGGDVAAMRDYAMLRFYFATGKRRAEVATLVWGDLSVAGDKFVFTTKHKGGIYQATEVNDPDVLTALYTYLKASGRWDVRTDTPELAEDAPLWIRHDNAAKGIQGVTSHGFVKALKKYALRAGIGDIHLHQTRHTVARMAGDESGDMSEVQALLGHQNIATTRVYLQTVSVKKDKFSQKIGARLKFE